MRSATARHQHRSAEEIQKSEEKLDKALVWLPYLFTIAIAIACVVALFWRWVERHGMSYPNPF